MWMISPVGAVESAGGGCVGSGAGGKGVGDASIGTLPSSTGGSGVGEAASGNTPGVVITLEGRVASGSVGLTRRPVVAVAGGWFSKPGAGLTQAVNASTSRAVTAYNKPKVVRFTRNLLFSIDRPPNRARVGQQDGGLKDKASSM